MILPIKIEIQIVDRSGRSNPLSNVIFGLRVYLTADTWYNYSAFKTNSEGYIILTKQEILDNTEIGSDNYGDSSAPTKFKLYAWDGQLITTLIKSTRNLLTLYNDNEFVQKDLSKLGITEENIPAAINITNAKRVEDMAFYEKIKDAINGSVQIYTEKIEDVWTDTLPRKYFFTIE